MNLLATGMKEIKDYLKQILALAIYNPTWLQQPHIKPLAKIFYAIIKGYFFANLTCSDVQNI